MELNATTETTTGARRQSTDQGKEKRTSRACLICRKRKSACHLPVVDGVVTTPCQRCKATGLECVIGSSNRGGRRVRKRTLEQANNEEDGSLPSSTPRADGISSGYAESQSASGLPVPPMQPSPSPAMFIDPALQSNGSLSKDNYISNEANRDPSMEPNHITFNNLQNPSDALGILAQIASHGGNASPYPPMYNYSMNHSSQGTLEYPLVRDGKLSLSKVTFLMERYKHHYHPYFPLVPIATLDPANLARTALLERHLLTAILVIASRDLTDEPDVFAACSEYMRSTVSALAAGGPGNVEAVEALLLLAEWTPYTARSDAGHVGRGEEDREAWMHVGTALRIGYFLGLDRYAFVDVGDDVKDPQWQRKRLVWTACYISDRQISIRLGRAFWSRGPGPLTTLRKKDFPMLAPAAPGDEDFASIFQATLELTLLFSNVHDVLYSNPGNSMMRNHQSGAYIKYIDDFRTSIYSWKLVWGTLSCSPNLKATLSMSYDYLRLYTNAFAFHATVKRALPQTQGQDARSKQIPNIQRVFFGNVGSVGDARFIYEGLDAAKSILSMCNAFVDPEKGLRFMPLRFHLYCVYSAVFLYRARCAGVLAPEEENSVRSMVHETVDRLERAGIGSQHPGSRYAQLVKLLWAGGVGGPAPAPTAPGTVAQDSPAATEMMGDFSWADLDAIGNFAVNGGTASANVNDADWWSGFLPADSNNFLYDKSPGIGDWNIGLQ